VANGDKITAGAYLLTAKLLDAQSASHSGVWIDVMNHPDKSFHADAIETGGTVEIMVRNDEFMPLGATNGPVALTLTPTVLLANDPIPFRWVKAKKTAGGTPAPSTVIMNARAA
jgi:hypothetical protein